MRFFKTLSLTHQNLLFSIVLLFVFASIVFCSSLILQRNLLIENLVEQTTEIGDTWVELIDKSDVKKGLTDFNHNSIHNKRVIDQLTLLTEKNKNIAQAYLFEAPLKNGVSRTLAQPQNILNKGVKLGEGYEQPDEWVKAAEILLKTKKPTHTKVYTDKFGTWVTTIHPIFYDNEIIAFFAIDMDASIVKQGHKDLAFVLIGIFLLFTCMIIIIQFVVLKKMYKPLKEVLNGINEVSTGNFDYSLPHNVQSQDLSVMIKNFNHMSQQLKELFDNVKQTSSFLNEKRYSKNQFTSFSDSMLGEALLQVKHIQEQTQLIENYNTAEKLQTTAQLAAVFAHEIRNPLTTIKGFLKICLKDNPTEPLVEIYSIMLKEVESIQTTIEKYIKLAQPEIKQYEWINIERILHLCVDLTTSKNKNIRKLLEIDNTLKIFGIKKELLQVFLTIITNAIESMKGKGELTVLVENRRGFAVITIADTGVGMTPEEIQKLGTPFYSTKVKGTGTGLMTAFLVVSKMKGTINIQSEKNAGTKVIIELPIDKS